MSSFVTYAQNKSFSFLDDGLLPANNRLIPFALTDCLIEFVGRTHQPMIHFWQLDQTVILGMKDTRVPDFTKGVAALRNADFQPLVRNSGGLGVVNDTGVLNVSLILPNPPTDKWSIDAAYELMYSWLSLAFGDDTHPITTGAVKTSYCPGTFDLSLFDKKFAGLAQRRVKDGLAIMAYISINGNQAKRGALMRDFYQAGLGEGFGTDGYPAVDPTVMANLDQLLGTPLTVTKAKERLLRVIDQPETTMDFEHWQAYSHTAAFDQELAKNLKKMEQRNEILSGDLN